MLAVGEAMVIEVQFVSAARVVTGSLLVVIAPRPHAPQPGRSRRQK
jgi:hypothetical protein